MNTPEPRPVHPRRGSERLNESIKNLRAMVSAIKKRDGVCAEYIARLEVGNAEQEVMRLIAEDSM